MKLTCPFTELLLVFTEEFQQPEALQTMRERSAIPLVVLTNDTSLESYSLEQYLFTQPSSAGDVALLGALASGELTYAGKVQVSDSGFAFALKSVDTPYATAIDVQGYYDSNRRQFEFTKAVSSTKVAAREARAQTPSKVSPSLE